MNEAAASPKKRSETRRKGRVLSIRVSDGERQEVEAFAEREGLTVASYIRSKSLATPTTRAMRRPPVEVITLSTLQASLNKIGSNLNQIAKRMNSGEMIAQSHIQAALAEHRQILAAIILTLGRQSR